MQISHTSRVYAAFREKERAIRSFVHRYFSDQTVIEDICQETIARALAAEKVRAIQSADAFLFGVARNIVRSELETKSKSLLNFVEDFAPYEADFDSPSIEQVMDDHARMVQFAESVLRMPRQCQRVFVLKKVYGYSHKEISSELDISISTIEKHVAAGMKRCLDDMGAANASVDDTDASSKSSKTV
ncbi:MAG: RNA polymerase sigma factor [Pseudomonadota bacterium]